MTEDLADRYRALLRRWYPADYVTARGDEIVSTYLDLAEPGQVRPRAGDVADLVRGGLREHLRSRDAEGLTDALPFAASVALATGAALAGVWLVLAETVTVPAGIAWSSVGPFVTLGAVVWIAWLLASVAALAGLGRPAVALAVLVTVAVVPVSAVTPYARPPLFVLVPQVALGVVCLAVRGRRPMRAPVFVAAAATCAAALSHPGGYYYSLFDVLLAAAVAVAVAVVGAGVVFTVRRDSRGWWPVLLLLCPGLLLATTLAVTDRGQPWPQWSSAAVSVAAAVLITVGAVALAIQLPARWRRGDRGYGR